jgi:hypothetical protein
VTDSLAVGGNRRITVVEDGATPIDGDDGGPTPPVVAGYRLFPNAPNPFNPVTRIGYELGEPTPVWLTIHDIAGRRVRVLLDGLTQRKGRWEARWDGLDDGGRPVASGVYRYRLRAGAFAETRSMTLLR